MRTMKDSGVPWIGEIPEGWNIDRLQVALQEIVEKNSPIKTDYILSLTNNRGVIPYTDKGDVGNKSKDNLEDYKVAYPNTIVANSMNILIGSVGICDYYGCVSPVYYVFQATEKGSLRFFNYIMSSEPFQKHLRQYANGILEIRLRLSSSNILKRYVPFPSLAEQQRIAEFLDRKCAEVDEMIALQEQIIEELKAYKQSVITEAVTKGLNPAAPMRDSGIEWIDSIPEHWGKDKIIRSFRMIGSGTTPKSTDENNFDGDINWIQSGDINGGVMESCKNRVSYETIENCSALKVYSAPFIIVAMYGASVGNTSISSIDGCVNQACCVLSDSALNFNYAFSVIKSCKDYWLRKAVGGGQPNISQETIKQTWIPIPPITEQQAIADYLDEKCADIDSLIQTKQSKIDSLKEYKKSIIYEYVTGKREVE